MSTAVSEFLSRWYPSTTTSTYGGGDLGGQQQQLLMTFGSGRNAVISVKTLGTKNTRHCLVDIKLLSNKQLSPSFVTREMRMARVEVQSTNIPAIQNKQPATWTQSKSTIIIGRLHLPQFKLDIILTI